MTYRDQEAALKARVQALEDQAARAASEHAELAAELAQASEELEAWQGENAPPTAPPWMLAVGAAGAGLAASFALLSLQLPGVLGGMLPALRTALYMGSSVAMALGLLGLARGGGGRLLQVAGWFCLVETAIHICSWVVLWFTLVSKVHIAIWGIYAVGDLLLGVALVRGRVEPAGLRVVTGVLYLVQAFISLVFMVAMALDQYQALVALVGPNISSLVHITTSGLLAWLFHKQYRTLASRNK